MDRLLPGSSEPPALEIRRLQQQCDRVRIENEIQSRDAQDEEACLELILGIEASSDRSPTKRLRFSNPVLVGLGSFGLVFSCDDFDQGSRRVALKMLRPSRHSDRIARERFQEEMRVMSQLHHPNIVQVFGHGNIRQIPYIVTEFADAGSLALVIIESRQSISPRQAAWLVSRVAEAVDEAHSTPILHRDIKPGNILLRHESPALSEGLGLWPMLTDFGLSKSLGPQSTIPLTFEGEVLGTLSYMSPEQVRGQPLKTQSDIFPLGVILHELAHGQHPFLDDSDFQTRTNIVQSEPFKPQSRHRRVPAPLDAIISKCLQKSPEDRYLHASDLAADLEHFLNGEPISVSPPTPWQTAVRWASSHPIACTFIATALTSILAGILLLSREWRIEWELAQASQSLAADRSRIGQLFLESMRATNSGINDAIVSGKRVLPSELLQTLEQQIPLLEDARRLDPNDQRLIRQLEIMYHYQSLCCATIVFDGFGTERQKARSKAVAAREKSLHCIDILLERDPHNETLNISKINGLYLMSTLHIGLEDPKEFRWWLEQSLASANRFLAEHPDQLLVQETRNRIRIHLAGISESDPQNALNALRSAATSSLDLFQKNPKRTSNLVYAVEGFAHCGNMLLNLGRHVEADADFKKLDEILSELAVRYFDDWSVLEAVIEQYVARCYTLFRTHRFEDLAQLAAQLESFIDDLKRTNYALRLAQPEKNLDCLSLRALHFHWLAVSRLSPDSEEEREIAIKCIKALERCRASEELNPDNLEKHLRSLGLPLGPLEDRVASNP